MATCFSILAWEIPCTEEPGEPQSMGLQRVGHNLETKQQSSLLQAHLAQHRKCTLSTFCYVHPQKALLIHGARVPID